MTSPVQTDTSNGFGTIQVGLIHKGNEMQIPLYGSNIVLLPLID